MKEILDQKHLTITLKRLCKQLIENHNDFNNTVILGLQPRGIYFADNIVSYLTQMLPNINIQYGTLDATFYRDDLMQRKTPIIAKETNLNFSLENKNIVLIDDVLYTGRTIRAALDAITDYGRPAKVELMVLINRRFKRQLPISPDYVGKQVDSITSQKVKVIWGENDLENKVLLIDK